jgi:hypothetical protein
VGFLVSRTKSAGQSGFPDLESLYGVPWTVTWPTAPTITADQSVTPANIASHQNTAGLRLTLTAGSYSGMTLAGSVDQEWVVGSNVVFTGAININTGVSRLKIRFSTPRDPTSNLFTVVSAAGAAPQDVLLDGVNADCTDGSGIHMKVNGTRYAIINSHFQSDSYGFWSDDQSFQINTWNSTFEGGDNAGNAQSMMRITNTERSAFCRCRWVKHNTGLLIRIYTESDVQFSDNQVEAAEGSGNNSGNVLDTSGATNAPTFSSHGTRFLRNHVWNDSGGPLNTGAASGSTGPILLQDNVSHGSAWPTTGIPTGYTMTNNTDVAFAAPDAWSYE